MVLPAPLSTLFPYTTLFRSRPPSPWPSEAEPALGRAAYRHLGAVRGWTPIRSWAAAPTHTTTDPHDDRHPLDPIVDNLQSEGEPDHMTALSPILKQATPVVVDHAEGCWIHGTDGRRYLDFTAGIGVTSTGHCHPRVVEAARA